MLVTGVLKIHVKCNKNDKSWDAGTGWLLRKDLLVTAAHVVRPSSCERAVHLNAYAGYRGLGSVGKPAVQKRRAKRVLVLKAYYDDNRSYTDDVAIVKLREPFENVRPFTHCETPEQETESLLGVVGYPADKDRYDVEDLGPLMYEQFAPTSWNLHKSYKNLLQYQISTFAGR